jgi:4a-hydroxytetrahydrobiopterin dehydratase
MNLIHKHCLPCEGEVPPLSKKEVREYRPHVPLWTVARTGKRIVRTFMFADFKETMLFVRAVAKIAEREGHHPDIHVSYGKVRIELSTHAVGALSKNDFILAAKIDRIVV